MKAKRLFITDLLLLITFIPTSTTGFVLHWAGHQNNHELWHNWAVVHFFSALLFTLLTVLHIYDHRGWYKSLLKSGIKNKSRVTITLSVLIWIVIVTGFAVLFRHQGANSHLGLKHYIIGIIVTVIAIGHFIKRHNTLFKGLKNNIKK